MRPIVILSVFLYIVSAHSSVFFCKLIKTNVDDFSPNGRPVFGYIEFDEANDFLGLELIEDDTRSPDAKTFKRKCYDYMTTSRSLRFYSCEQDDEWSWGDVVGKMKIPNSQFSYPRDSFIMSFQDSAANSNHYDFKTRPNTLREFYCKKQ
jgi:hypothetical protein